jgi:hypothetical protein
MLSTAMLMSRGDSMTLLELAYDSNMASLPKFKLETAGFALS